MEQLAFTALLNRLFGAPVLALLLKLNIHPKYPATPITNAVAMEILVVLLLTIFFIAVRSQLSVERPGALQHTMEGIDGFIQWPGQRDDFASSGEIRPVFDRAGFVHSELQSNWTGPGTGIAYGGADGAAGLRAVHLVLLSLPWCAGEWAGRIPEAFHRAARGHADGGPVILADPVISD